MNTSSVLFTALLALTTLSAIGQPKFSAALDRESVILGETAALTLKFENGAPREVPAFPQIPGLQVAGVSSSSQTSLGPTGSSTIQSFTMTLVPQRPGEFVIPPLTAQVEGRTLQSQPLKLKVLQSDTNAPPAEYSDKLAFLWLVLPRKEVYVGEVFVVELRLYLRGNVRNLSNAQIPPFSGEGFTSSKFVEGQAFQRRVGSVAYRIIPLQMAMTAVKTGSLPLGQLKGSLVVHVPSGVESFFGPVTTPQAVELSLENQSIEVLPLPTENVPSDFTGIVGKYALGFNAGPTNLAAGDPITLKIQLSGRGHLDSLTLPERDWRDFKVYPPTSRVETTDQLGIEGSKFFEQVVVPQNPEVKELPALSISYFDPESKRYQTLKQPALPLLVRPSGSVPAPTIISAAKTDRDAPSQDIVHIKPRAGTLANLAPPLIQRPWFLGLQLLPIAALLTAFAWRKRVDKLANNPRMQRQRRVTRLMRQGVDDLRRLAAENNSDAFFVTLFRLLQEQLGERLDLPTSSITEAVIEEHLRPRGVPNASLAALQELFQTCNFARYAPIKSTQELQAIVPKFEAVIADLQNRKL